MITYDEAKTALKEVVAGNEDFVYQQTNVSCTYVQDGKPDCGIGHVLIKHFGFTPEWFMDDSGASYARNMKGIKTLVEIENISIAPRALTLLSVFQREQDAFTPWGDALQRAVNYAEIDLNMVGTHA
jgi:hypothetical protein